MLLKDDLLSYRKYELAFLHPLHYHVCYVYEYYIILTSKAIKRRALKNSIFAMFANIELKLPTKLNDCLVLEMDLSDIDWFSWEALMHNCTRLQCFIRWALILVIARFYLYAFLFFFCRLYFSYIF